MYYLHYASGAESRPVGVRSQPSSDGARTGTAVWPNDVICCVDVLVVGAEEWAVLEDGGGYVNVRHPATGARLLRVVSEAAAADIWRSASGGGGGEPSDLAASLADVSARQRRVDEDIRAARRQLELSRRELAEMRRLADALRRERAAVNELEAALVREAALQVELSRARCATKAAVRDATAELKRRVADLEDERDVERGAFDDQLRRLLDDKARAEAEARAAKAALSDAQLDERRRAATHYRKKLDAYKKAHPPAPPKKKDALDFGPPPPRPDPLNETIGKGNTA